MKIQKDKFNSHRERMFYVYHDQHLSSIVTYICFPTKKLDGTIIVFIYWYWW